LDLQGCKRSPTSLSGMLRLPRHGVTTGAPANRNHQSRSRPPPRGDGPALCCARPGVGMTHGGGDAAEMLLITGVHSGPPWSSVRRRSRGCTGTFEEPSPRVRPKPRPWTRLPHDLWRRLSRRFPVHAARRCRRATSLGVVNDRPSVVRVRGVHSRRRPRGHRLRTGAASSDRVPSSWFRTTSTACSSIERAGPCGPAADHGVRRVSGSSEEPFPRRTSALQSLAPPEQRCTRRRRRVPWATVTLTGHVAVPARLHPSPCLLAVA